jgi:hypothetical protein
MTVWGGGPTGSSAGLSGETMIEEDPVIARKFGDSATVERLGMTDARASAAVARVAALLRRWSAPTLRGGGLVFRVPSSR